MTFLHRSLNICRALVRTTLRLLIDTGKKGMSVYGSAMPADGTLLATSHAKTSACPAASNQLSKSSRFHGRKEAYTTRSGREGRIRNIMPIARDYSHASQSFLFARRRQPFVTTFRPAILD